MSYLTLSEAAEYTSHKTGLQIDPASMLRAGVHGVLLIAAPFSSLMRNLTASKNDDVLGLLVIPPRHLLEIEAEGQTKIVHALSLDGKTGYSPQVVRTRDQLRILVNELDSLMPYWVTNQQTAPAPDITAPVPVVPLVTASDDPAHLTTAPATDTPTPAPVVVETTEQRRARWLDWYGRGERGAVQRVYERELLLNPKADRSFIGKEINKAKSEKAETKRGGAMFGQLVQDGKRMG